MIPDGVLSTRAVVGHLIDPAKQPCQRTIDYERGGIALQDPSQGLQVQVWTLEVIGADVTIHAPSSPRQVLFTAPDISEASLAFDQAMRPFVAYIQAGVAKYWWYDTSVQQQIHSTLGTDCRCLRCTTDEKRAWHWEQSDIVLFYLRADQLYMRSQRERYQTEHALRTVGTQAELISVGLSDHNRLQFRLRHVATQSAPMKPDHPLEETPGSVETLDERAVLQTKPSLAETVADLYRRSGLPDAAIDVSALGATELEGFKVATEGGADAMVQALQSAFFFDPVECDKRLIAKTRGGDPVKALTMDDLVERDDSALTITRVQEAELLRKVNVTTLDSTIDYASNKQTAERLSSTIKATGESSLEIALTASPAFAASVAEKRLRIAWGEPLKYQFALSLAQSDLTPGDVVTLQTPHATQRLRIGMVSEEDDRLEIEATTDAQWIYRDVTASGIKAPPPTSTTPGTVGHTTVAVLNLPVLNDSDDAPGYYVAVHGEGSAWTGAELQLSLDDGATVAQRLAIQTPAVIGKTLTALLGEVSAEMPSTQTLQVHVTDDLESVRREDLQRYCNRAAIQHADGSWEVIQFQTAIAKSVGTYELSGLVRGRYATTPSAVPSGATFVLLEEAVTFVPLPLWMLQQQLHVRAVSDGQAPDAVAWTALSKGSIASQTEWPVHGVWSRRDANQTVNVGWIGRARLGIETAPRHSQYFAGYRVIYSDGFTAETTETTHVRTNAPTGLKVSVAPINRLTGDGAVSKEIMI